MGFITVQKQKITGKRLLISAGCIPVRVRKGKVKVCLINSRKRNGVLVFPKGKVERGESIVEAAIRETYEEAGLRGEVMADPVVVLNDRNPTSDKYCVSHFYPMMVDEEADSWQEDSFRIRKWVSWKKLQKDKQHQKVNQVLAQANEKNILAFCKN